MNEGGEAEWCSSVWGADTCRDESPSGPWCSGHKLSPKKTSGQSTQTKDSDLTKWAVNDSPVPNKIMNTDEGGGRLFSTLKTDVKKCNMLIQHGQKREETLQTPVQCEKRQIIWIGDERKN